MVVVRGGREPPPVKFTKRQLLFLRLCNINVEFVIDVNVDVDVDFDVDIGGDVHGVVHVDFSDAVCELSDLADVVCGNKWPAAKGNAKNIR